VVVVVVNTREAAIVVVLFAVEVVVMGIHLLIVLFLFSSDPSAARVTPATVAVHGRILFRVCECFLVVSLLIWLPFPFPPPLSPSLPSSLSLLF